MKVVRTFATSANLGPGFDTLGICFNIYNEYAFIESNCFSFEGFPKEYCNEKNLIIYSYKKVFEYLNEELKYINLKQIEQNIPTSRGLGSSASCIVAGIMIANDILGNKLGIDEQFQIASSIEGHPDNVAPLIYGGLTCSFKEDIFYKIKLEVNQKYHFLVCIPPFELSTELARKVLPAKVDMKDAVYNISHTVATIESLRNGDMELLKKSCKDLLHQPYRYSLIENSDIINKYAIENNCVCMISGAGSTLLLVGVNGFNNIKILKDWIFTEVYVNHKGAYIYEK